MGSAAFWDPGHDFSAELIIFFKSTFNIISYYLYYTTPTSFLQHFHASFQPPRLHNSDITRSNVPKSWSNLDITVRVRVSNNGRSRDGHVMVPDADFPSPKFISPHYQNFKIFVSLT